METHYLYTETEPLHDHDCQNPGGNRLFCYGTGKSWSDYSTRQKMLGILVQFVIWVNHLTSGRRSGRGWLETQWLVTVCIRMVHNIAL
jgi:hypothetical protein